MLTVADLELVLVLHHLDQRRLACREGRGGGEREGGEREGGRRERGREEREREEREREGGEREGGRRERGREEREEGWERERQMKWGGSVGKVGCKF